MNIQQVIYYTNQEFHGVKYETPYHAALASLAKQFQDAIHANRIEDAERIYEEMGDILDRKYIPDITLATNTIESLEQ